MIKIAGDSTMRGQLLIHVAVVLFGFTAILGKLIELPGASIVWYRMLFTCTSLFFFPKILKRMQAIPRKEVWQISGIGVIIILHWIGFYEAIKYSNASITVSCMASITLFTAFLEPLLFKRRIKVREILLGIVVILGFLLMFGFVGEDYALGMSIAFVSAFLAAIFSILNKSIVSRYNVFAITQIQFLAGWAFLTLFAPVYWYFFPDMKLIPSTTDWLYLFILAIVCTTLAYSLNMYALRYLSAFTANLAFNMEPIYGMLMAYFLLREDKELNPGFYLGAAIILLAVLGNGIWSRIQNRKVLSASN